MKLVLVLDKSPVSYSEWHLMRLHELATARSGDKGNHANIGIVARDAAAFSVLRRHLTAQRVAEYFQDLNPGRVTRYELPRVQAFNFLLENVLRGGASESLRVDTQGKLLGTAILQLHLPDET